MKGAQRVEYCLKLADRCRSMHSLCETPAHTETHTHLHYLIDELTCRCFPCFWNGSQSGVPIAIATSIEEQITVGD